MWHRGVVIRLAELSGAERFRTDKIDSQQQFGPNARPSGDGAHATRILARSFYKELRKSGYSAKELVALSTELIALITRDLRDDRHE
jgi:hypothetical protein